MIFIGVGSSIGQAEEHFAQAISFLSQRQVNIIKTSETLKNPPQGGVAQNEFTNAVWQVEFKENLWEKINWVLLPQSRRLRLKAFKLLRILQAAENNAKRRRDFRWDDRTLDLDILQFHQLVLNTKRLTIPHPRLSERDFVLLPWQELVDKDFEIPTFGKLTDLLKKIKN